MGTAGSPLVRFMLWFPLLFALLLFLLISSLSLSLFPPIIQLYNHFNLVHLATLSTVYFDSTHSIPPTLVDWLRSPFASLASY